MAPLNEQELDIFIATLRAEMARHDEDPNLLLVDPDRSRLRLAHPDGEGGFIRTAGLDDRYGGPRSMGEAAHRFYREAIERRHR